MKDCLKDRKEINIGKENTVRNKSPQSYFYRPFIELDCVMTKHLVREGEFSANPLVVGDVGVRSGFDPLWDIFADQCRLIGFEPDKEECVKLESKYKDRYNRKLPGISIENTALWDRDGKVNFHVMRDPDTSSCFLPNDSFFKRLPDPSPMDVEKIIEITTTTLDGYHQRKGIDFDVLKIDVQGGELEVLKGAVQQLDDSVLAVIAEVEFVKLYEGQNLFSDVDIFMREHGFALFDLDIRRWRRKALPEAFDGIRMGQTIYADALYMWDPLEQNCPGGKYEAKSSKLMKLAALAECFSLPDYAMEILSAAEKCLLISKGKEKELVKLLEDNRIVAKYDRNKIS